MPPMNTIPISKEPNEQIPLEPASVPVKAKETAPPKVDRPRPHVCSTCTRSFARLEHLKRHERSHTKEKPFECPECLRCFARRDLLLRHQQKLHLTTTPSSRPRNGVRRESTSSVAQPAGSRVRKNSVSNAGGRPRANTIAHVDSNTLSLLAKTTTAAGQNLPKLETGSLRGLNVVGTSLGASTVVPQELDIEGILFGNPTTVNPAMLQFSASPHANTFGSPTSPFEPVFSNSTAVIDDDDDSPEWMMLGAGLYTSEQAVESSSPSAISTTSISAVSEALQDTNTWWNNNASTLSSATTLSTSPFMSASDYNAASFNPSPPPPAGTISPKALQAQGNHHDLPFFANYSMSNISPGHFLSPESHFQPEIQHEFPHEYSGFHPTTPAAHATQTITDSARAAILLTLAQSSNAYRNHQQVQHQRRYSSAQSPPLHGHRNSFTAQLPATQDLQKYVQGYIKHFHPHMPFFHIATLDFSSPSYAVTQKKDNLLGLSGFAGGGGCLILSMSAIGALYAGEVAVAKEIYEAAKKMIHVFIDNRRKASVSAAVSGNGTGAQSTPLWLVQSMLLNVVFGLNSGEHMSSELALSHCTAVVSLARNAGLCKPYTNVHSTSHLGPDASMLDMWNGAMKLESLDDHADWIKWIAEEERKRTLYAVHKLSSMLCITYNHAPALTNSEIRLDLPCDEELWGAETATMWKMRGGIQAAKQAAVPFSMALNTLLSANAIQAQQERAQNGHDQKYMNPHGKLKPSELRPSHFGALSLILALHVYIWETRQLSQSRQFSATEVEAVHAHIEPALRAWEEAWASHPQSSIERPSPFGIGPMAADSIPLLNLAYVRLFVDLGMSRGPLFARDFSGMIDELNKNWAEQPTTASSSNSSASESADTPPGSNSSPGSSPNSTLTSPDLNPSKVVAQYQAPYSQGNGISSRREKHIRRAAFYAADALAMSEKSGLSSPDFLSRELPMQSLMCAFDCAQVLAEWVNAVQERVRPFMGKFGDAECDLMSIEALMMLENEDRVLLGRVIEILKKSHDKMVFEWDSIVGGNDEVSVSILRVSAHLLEKASVWPVVRIYSSALRYHADNIESRPKNTGILGLH